MYLGTQEPRPVFSTAPRPPLKNFRLKGGKKGAARTRRAHSGRTSPHHHARAAAAAAAARGDRLRRGRRPRHPPASRSDLVVKQRRRSRWHSIDALHADELRIHTSLGSNCRCLDGLAVRGCTSSSVGPCTAVACCWLHIYARHWRHQERCSSGLSGWLPVDTQSGFAQSTCCRATRT